MNTPTYFSIRRLRLLLRNELILHKHTVIVSTVTIAAVLFLFDMVFGARAESMHPHLVPFFATLFLGGIWISGKAFSNLHHPQKGFSQLMLPASHLEKLLSKLLLTSIGYAIATLLFFSLFYSIMHGISVLTLKKTITYFHPLDPVVWHYIGVYCIWQSMALLASLYFRRHPLLKLCLVLACFLIGINLIAMFIAIVFFHNYFFHFLMIPNLTIVASPTIFGLNHAVYLSFWFGLAPFCWILSYLRLTESEI